MSPEMSQGTAEPDEETPLLHDGKTSRKETPLPITQVLVLLLLQLCEPITSQSINPYINQVRFTNSHYVGTIDNVCFSFSVSFQSLVVTKEKSDTTRG